MDAIEVLRRQADLAFAEFKMAFDGIDRSLAWGRLPLREGEFLHTDGSIQAIVLHVASCKFMYGSICFRGTEIRWREMADRIERFEPDWPAALRFLEEGHSYWMDSWADLDSARLADEAPHHSGEPRPIWKLLATVIHHDAYHGGQIAAIRASVQPSKEPPLSTAEDIRTYCADLASF